MSEGAMPRKLIPYDEAMHILGGVGRSTLHQLMKDGRLERVKLGSRGFITVESIDRFIEQLRAEP